MSRLDVIIWLIGTFYGAIFSLIAIIGVYPFINELPLLNKVCLYMAIAIHCTFISTTSLR